MAAEDQPKKYDVTLAWKNVEGHKSELSQDDSRATMTKVLDSDGKILTQQDENQSRSFSAVQVISKIKDGKPAAWRWTFSKATQHRENQDVPFAFQGRTVVGTKDPAGKIHFCFDDGNPVSTEDATVLAGLWESDEPEPGEPSAEEMFAPKRLVAVGEQWMPDTAKLVRLLKLDDFIDLKKSNVKATLTSTEMRDGVEFGHIKMFMELWATKIGPMELDNPILFKAEVDMDSCIDGAQPDHNMNLTVNATGYSAARVDSPPRQVQLSLTLEGKVQTAEKTIR